LIDGVEVALVALQCEVESLMGHIIGSGLVLLVATGATGLAGSIGLIIIIILRDIDVYLSSRCLQVLVAPNLVDFYRIWPMASARFFRRL
jgi:hypothetical protein